jgi:hypothetical protein
MTAIVSGMGERVKKIRLVCVKISFIANLIEYITDPRYFR